VPKTDRIQTVVKDATQGQNAPFSSSELDFLTREAAENALILEPTLPAQQLAERIQETSDVEFLVAITRILLLRYFTAAVRRVRAAQKRSSQMVFPGFEHLPLWIKTEKGTRIRTENAMYTQVRFHYRWLKRRERQRSGSNARLLEFQRLLASMREQQAESRGLKVGAVMRLEGL
jgi:hypothetical protein